MEEMVVAKKEEEELVGVMIFFEPTTSYRIMQ
jgi:hypothetical protein